MVDPLQFRTACRQWGTGVTVVTVRDGERARGMTANTFTAISLDPPLIAVSILKSARTHDLMRSGSRFAISVLAVDQKDLSDRFAGRQGDVQEKFEDVPHTLTSDGLPIIEGSLAHFICAVDAIYPGGDHSVFLGRVEEVSSRTDRAPLLFYDREYRGLGPAL